MLLVPAKPGGEEVLGDFAAVGVGVEELVDEGGDDDADQDRDPGLEAAEAVLLQGEDREGAGAGDDPGGEERDPEQQVEAEGGADDLGDVAGHRDDLRLQPEADRGAGAEALAAELGEVAAGGDAELGRLRLDQHRDEVGGQDDPEQQVAELGAAGDVGGEVAGVDVGDRGDEGRPEERPEPTEATRVAVERGPRGDRDGGLAGQGAGGGMTLVGRLERLLHRAQPLVGRVHNADPPGSVMMGDGAGGTRSGPGIGLPWGSWLGSPSLAAISASSSSEM